MDLRLYGRVIWRFRFVVLLGLVLAVLLALLSYVKVSFKGGSPSFTYRQAEAWQSNTRLLVGGGQGFPQGQAYTAPSGNTAKPAAGAAATADFTGLAVYYKQLANSDAVQRILARDRSLRGSMVATYDVDSTTKSPLPVLIISGVAATPAMAQRISARGAAAFHSYLNQRASAAGIPPKQRVKLTVLNAPLGAVLVSKRKMTLPIVVFLTVIIAAIGLAFVLENLRPPIRLVESQRDDELLRRRDSA
jgi:hypothetical protein